jgi:SPP1 gp7 family putative phage head morphogenesis protein
MINPAEKIGLKWAKTISNSFQDWAAQEKKSRTIKINPFNATPLITDAFLDAGSVQLDQIGKLIGMGVKFDLKSPEAIAWCAEYGAKEVKYINAGTKAAIRQVTLRGLQEGISPAEQSKEIKKVIGLLPQHVIAVQNYQGNLIESGTDEATAERMADKYGQRLLKYRADTIGLTESLTATNEGTLQATEDAADNGILSKEEYQLEWLYTNDSRACDECEGLDGKNAPIGGTFPNGSRGPPAHPRCRCTTIIVKQ